MPSPQKHMAPKNSPLSIGKANKLHAFQKKTGQQIGFYYHNIAKAWMPSTLYEECIRKWA